MRLGLLLIDFQRSFTDGPWASHFGGRAQVEPILRAVTALSQLYRSGRLEGLPTLATRCYLDGPAAEPPAELARWLEPVPWVCKSDTNVVHAPGFGAWLDRELAAGLDTLLVGGCTTTSCVRVSSQAVKVRCPGLRVVVDLSLCGARADNYLPERAVDDPVLRREYGELVEGRSAAELAVLQMRAARVEVVDSFFEPLELAARAVAGVGSTSVLASESRGFEESINNQ